MILLLTISVAQVGCPNLRAYIEGIYDFGSRQMLIHIGQTVPKFQGENFYKNKAIVDEIKKLATKKGCTITQVALAWVAAQGMIAIPGTTKAKRLEENWSSRDIEFTEEEMKEMRQIVENAKPVGERFNTMFGSMVGH